MKRNDKYIVLDLFIIFVSLFSCSHQVNDNTDSLADDATTTVASKKPFIDGTFLPYYLISDWGDGRWELELANLKKLGMHYLILTPTVFTDKNNVTKSIYPSKYASNTYSDNDLVENCLRNAKKFGFKVFIGLNSNEKWWSWWKVDSEDWLYAQMEHGNKIAKELIVKYKNRYSDTMYGWYWDWEIDNLNYTTDDRQQILIKALNTNIEYLNQLTPEMPRMLSPFMNYKVGHNATAYRAMWEKIFSSVHFKKGDIFCPQDCIGAGGLTLNNAGEWFRELAEAVKSKPGLVLWSNSENFDQRFWTSATLDRFIKQLQITQPFVSNNISFTYSYYYSPYQVNKYFDEAYSYYIATGNLPLLPEPAPAENLRISKNKSAKTELSWDYPADLQHIVGFLIFRNDSLIANYQYNLYQYCKTTYTEKENLKAGTYKFSVCTYNAANGCSTKNDLQYTVTP